MKKTTILCDSCKDEGAAELSFAGERYIDVAGSVDYDVINIDLCYECYRKITVEYLKAKALALDFTTFIDKCKSYYAKYK